MLASVHSYQATSAWRVAAAVTTLPGLVVGHVVAYLLAYPSAHERAEHLHHTGHGAFPLLVIAGWAVLPLALGIAAMAALRAAGRLSVRQAALRVALLQTAAFLLLEVLERGGALVATVGDPAVLVGAALQPPVAAVMVYLLAAVAFCVRWAVLRRSRQRPGEPWSPLRVRFAHAAVQVRQIHICRSAVPRAPPHSLPA